MDREKVTDMDVRAENLRKEFGGQIVLNGFTHTFKEHETTCITGRSGCGKTTLLRILMGLEKPEQGEVTGMPGRIAAVFQEDRLCENLSGERNIRLVLPRTVASGEIREAMKQVGLSDAFDKPVRELSGGMRQRVSVLRALFMDADLIFMDEPLKGLDENTRKQTISYILEKTAGKTMIIVTHDKNDIEAFRALETVEMHSLS